MPTHENTSPINSLPTEPFWKIREDDLPVKYVDMITEFRHHNSVVYLSLGSAIMDMNGTATVEVATRIRFDIGTAENLRDMLESVILEIRKDT